MNRRHVGFASVSAAVALLVFSSVASAAPGYTFSDLGTFGRSAPDPAALNDAGVIVGTYRPGKYLRAFRYASGRVRNLGSLVGRDGEGMSLGLAINDAGVITGASVGYIPEDCSDCTDWQLVEFSGGDVVNFGSVRDYTFPDAINEYGEIVGTSAWEKSDESEGFLYSHGVFQELPPFPDQYYGDAQGIRDDGTIVGGIDVGIDPQNGDLPHHAYIYSGGRYQDLGTFAGNDGWSEAVNIKGRYVAGTSMTQSSAWNSRHAFLYMTTTGSMRDLGALAGDSTSGAVDVNSSGEVLGWSGADTQTPFLFTRGRMWNLQKLAPRGWTGLNLRAINAVGQMTGTAEINGKDHAVLLTPRCTIRGTRRADRIHGTRHADVICAGRGNDTVYPGGGNDIIIGGAGVDTVNYTNAPRGVSANLSLGREVGWGVERLGGVENVYGSAYADTLMGNGAANILSGSGGDDTIAADDGNDKLNGGPGVDSLDGGPGVDRCRTGPGGGSTTSCE